jgi:hypothetical protein
MAPPIKTLRRDISVLSFAIGSETFTLLMDRICTLPPSFEENVHGKPKRYKAVATPRSN